MPNLGLNKNKFEAANAGAKALKLLEESTKFEQPVIGADKYNESKLEHKLYHDANFFNHLGSKLEESEKTEFLGKLKELFETTVLLYKEVDMKPRTISQAVDSQELTENVIYDIYSKYLTENINKEYALPLLEGTLLEDHKSESKLLMESAIAADVIHDLNSELYVKYALFENTLFENYRRIILPGVLLERTENYINNQDSEYFELFENDAQTLLNNLNSSIHELVTLTAPGLFEESTGISASQFKGISKIFR